MAGIVFFFENYDVDVWSGRQIDLDAWNYAAKAAGDIDKIIVINKTREKINSPDADLKYFNVVSSLNEAENLINGNVAIICCPWDDLENKTSLWNFDHKCDWYIFGSAYGWRIDLDFAKKYKLYVTIPQANLGAMHSTHIASTVLLHRYSCKDK